MIESDPAKEAELVSVEIKKIRQADPGGNIAVLVRSRTHLQAIVPALKTAELRFRDVEIEELGQRAAIQDLIALTMAMHHFTDRVAWFAILRSPWCGLSLANLLILTGEENNRTLWFYIRAAEGEDGNATFTEQVMEKLST